MSVQSISRTHNFIITPSIVHRENLERRENCRGENKITKSQSACFNAEVAMAQGGVMPKNNTNRWGWRSRGKKVSWGKIKKSVYAISNKRRRIFLGFIAIVCPGLLILPYCCVCMCCCLQYIAKQFDPQAIAAIWNKKELVLITFYGL